MLNIYTLESAECWDKIVRSFRDYDTYWLSGYVKAFKINGDGEPHLFYYEDEACRGINVVMKRDIAEDKNFKGKIPAGEYFDISTPYGYGGWLIEGENTDGLFSNYDNWCKNNGIISEFVRFHPLIKNHIQCTSFYNTVVLGSVVTMPLESPELIWSNLTSKNRNMIRKAEKNGIEIFNGSFPSIYKEFKNIYNSTMDKDQAESYYYFDDSFYESILNDLPDNARVFYAKLGDNIIAASIMLICGSRMNYHLSGSLKEYSSLAPSNLLLYIAALWGNENSCKTLYLGGGVGSSEDSLFKFKKVFNRNECTDRFVIGKKIFIQNKYDFLLELRGDIESSFFPAYRA